jgi:L,D-transpeptidase catalytic domain
MLANGWNMKLLRLLGAYSGLLVAIFVGSDSALSQTPLSQTADDKHESERSDKITGGHVETAEFEAGQPDVRLTLNVPTFRLTLWQNGKEVKSYYVGVGMKDHPIYIGDRKATQIIWNPVWIPPDSPWVKEMSTVTSGEIIKASDPRNPLGKMKIPLGDRYLLHQAAGMRDLGNLVSHGCVRMLLPDLYDLSEKIIAARSLPVSAKRIASAKRSKKTFVVNLDDPVPVDINYDTLVVEEGALHIYPDVYGRRTSSTQKLRTELESAGVDKTQLNDRLLRRLLARGSRRTQFVLAVNSIAEGRLEGGKSLPLIPRRPVVRKQKAESRRQ